MTHLSRSKKLAMSGAAAVLMLTAACGGGSDTESESTDSSSSDETTEDASSTETATTYTVGDYSAEGSYQTPGGTQSVEVELSLEADGTITAVTVTPQADGGNSEQFQTKFAGGIADEVVGTKIDDLDVSKVSGSSLTSGGFNAAVDEIKAEAAA